MSATSKGKHTEVKTLSDTEIVVTLLDKKLLEEKDIQALGGELFAVADAKKEKPHQSRSIVVDFSRVEYCSAGVIGKLKTLDNKLKSRKDRLVFAAMKPVISEIFEVTGLTKDFNCYPESNAQQALDQDRAKQAAQSAAR